MKYVKVIDYTRKHITVAWLWKELRLVSKAMIHPRTTYGKRKALLKRQTRLIRNIQVLNGGK